MQTTAPTPLSVGESLKTLLSVAVFFSVSAALMLAMIELTSWPEYVFFFVPFAVIAVHSRIVNVRDRRQSSRAKLEIRDDGVQAKRNALEVVDPADSRSPADTEPPSKAAAKAMTRRDNRAASRSAKRISR